MKVRVTKGSHMVIKDTEYKPGDVLDMEDRAAKVQLEAGIVEEFKAKKEK